MHTWQDFLKAMPPLTNEIDISKDISAYYHGVSKQDAADRAAAKTRYEADRKARDAKMAEKKKGRR